MAGAQHAGAGAGRAPDRGHLGTRRLRALQPLPRQGRAPLQGAVAGRAVRRFAARGARAPEPAVPETGRQIALRDRPRTADAGSLPQADLCAGQGGEHCV